MVFSYSRMANSGSRMDCNISFDIFLGSFQKVDHIGTPYLLEKYFTQLWEHMDTYLFGRNACLQIWKENENLHTDIFGISKEHTNKQNHTTQNEKRKIDTKTKHNKRSKHDSSGNTV